jgi:hypothetical protein
VAAKHEWAVGEPIHGFAGGAFGRDSYGCRRVEAVGWDWIVTRDESGEPEFASGSRVPRREDNQPGVYCGCPEDV